MSKALVEAIKEGLRVAALAALGVVVLALESGSTNWKVIAVAAGVAALRAIDKLVHESPNFKAKGLLPW